MSLGFTRFILFLSLLSKVIAHDNNKPNPLPVVVGVIIMFTMVAVLVRFYVFTVPYDNQEVELRQDRTHNVSESESDP